MKQKNVVLMVIAVGCGLAAAFLTSQMNAKSQVEQIDVIVAAKDLPVGTTITREELNKLVKIKSVPKDALPPAYVTNIEELVDKRLSRPLRAEETFNPQDLLKGGAITLPPGYNMVSLPVSVGQAAAGFVGPGSRVDVIASVRLSNQLKAFPLLVNMLVVAVDTQTTYQGNGVFPTLNMVSFAVKPKEALVLSLAKSRGCNLELMLRHPETSNPNETNDDKLDAIIKLLSDERGSKALVAQPGGQDTPDGPHLNPNDLPLPTAKTPPTTEPKPAPAPSPEPPVAPPPSIATTSVLVAKRDIEPNTVLTNDLITTSFEWKELPKDYASEAVRDLSEYVGQVFKTGVAKGQWVTGFMIGAASSKAPPQDPFTLPKPAPTPEVKPVPIKQNYHDVAVHSASGTRIHRYVEVAPGQWKKLAELTPEQAAKSSATHPMPETPKTPDDPPREKPIE
ncbi:MAG: Flp pilus assembly protein CpaB [Gemmataceae bacterium]|nr:Flp pilus assembly protein CpaB [Gemmata sp.]MDW8198138.1 Flp pilus assembly protein CpaB [Gemmataceae bacterium]